MWLDDDTVITFKTSSEDQKSKLLQMEYDTSSIYSFEIKGEITSLNSEEEKVINETKAEIMTELGLTSQEVNQMIVPYKIQNYSPYIGPAFCALGGVALLVAFILLLPKITGKKPKTVTTPIPGGYNDVNSTYTGMDTYGNDVNNIYNNPNTFGNTPTNTYNNPNTFGNAPTDTYNNPTDTYNNNSTVPSNAEGAPNNTNEENQFPYIRKF